MAIANLTGKRINYLKQLIQYDEAEAQNIEMNMETWLLRSAKQYGMFEDPWKWRTLNIRGFDNHSCCTPTWLATKKP